MIITPCNLMNFTPLQLTHRALTLHIAKIPTVRAVFNLHKAL